MLSVAVLVRIVPNGNILCFAPLNGNDWTCLNNIRYIVSFGLYMQISCESCLCLLGDGLYMQRYCPFPHV